MILLWQPALSVSIGGMPLGQDPLHVSSSSYNDINNLDTLLQDVLCVWYIESGPYCKRRGLITTPSYVVTDPLQCSMPCARYVRSFGEALLT